MLVQVLEAQRVKEYGVQTIFLDPLSPIVRPSPLLPRIPFRFGCVIKICTKLVEVISCSPHFKK
jgi:hypothetical protein